MSVKIPNTVGSVNRYRYNLSRTISGMQRTVAKSLKEILRDNVKAKMERLKLGASADALRKKTSVGQGVAAAVLGDKGDTRLSTVEKIAKKLGTKPWELLSPEPNMEMPPLGPELIELYRKLSQDGRDALIMTANRLYSKEHPEDRRADPFQLPTPHVDGKVVPLKPHPNDRKPRA